MTLGGIVGVYIGVYLAWRTARWWWYGGSPPPDRY